MPISAANEDATALITAADSACQAAKDAGRNRIYTYQEHDIDLMRRRREMQWAARINNALEDSRFELFRQTILPLQQEERGAHYELLLRMRDESGSLVSPDLFIAAAERYGITPNIDRWVVEHALRWLVSEADARERLALGLDARAQAVVGVDDDLVATVVEGGGVLTTSGNLVFQGRSDGIVAAYRATDGRKLWEFDAGTGILTTEPGSPAQEHQHRMPP